MYGGEVELNFESVRHIYTYNGEKVPGVTTITGVINKPFLVGWASNMAADFVASNLEAGKVYDEMELINIIDGARKAHYMKKKSAGDVGTLVHNFLEQYITGQNPSTLVHEEARKAADRFMSWVNVNKVKFRLNEQQIYSRKHGYAGTLDFVCEIDGKLWLGDIKTSNRIYKVEYGAQMAAYRMARNEEFPDEKYEGCILVRVGKKEGEFELWEQNAEDMKKHERVFLGALELYKAMKEVEE